MNWYYYININIRLKMVKKTFKELSFKDKVSMILCVTSFGFGTLFAAGGLFLPPPGVIDASVITSFGIFLTFCGSILGINNHYKLQMEKIKSEISNMTDKK